MNQDTDEELAKLWQEAIERYTSITGVDLRTDPNAIKVTSGNDLMSRIEIQQAQFTKFCQRKAALWKVLDQIARVLETTTVIASDSIGHVFPPSSVIFAAVSYLIKRAKDVNTAYDSILDLLECLKVFITSIGLHAQHPIFPQLREIFVKKLSCFLVILGISTKLIKDGKACRILKNIVHGGDGSGLQARIDELETLSKHETTLINSLSLDSLTAVANDVERMSVRIMNKDRDGQLRNLKERLNPELSVETDYDNINNDLLLGTGDWLFSNPTVQKWFNGSASSLWVSGGPGQGKTYLSARVIRQLMGKYPQEVEHTSPTSVSYFLCRDTNRRTQLFSVILRTLAYQLARNDAVYRAYLLNILEPDSGTRVGTAQSWAVLFDKYFADNNIQSRAFIVLDGLDEATREGFEGVETFLKSLRQTLLGSRNNPSPRLKILLVGRPEMDDMIYDMLGSLTSTIELSRSHESDVVKYIKNQLSHARNLRTVSAAFRKEIMEKLSPRAFLWVKLVCKEIASRNKESRMRATLDALPRDLRETIHHVLERFSENDADDIADLNELLAWVTCARRPLTLGEMEVVMAMTSTDGEPILELERLLRKRYSTFFTLIRKDGMGTADLQNKSRRPLGNDISTEEDDFDEDVDIFDSPKDTTVHISHLVFLEYFRSQGQTTAVGIDISKAEVHLLLRCLALLCDEEKAERWKDETMIGYAREHWMSHLGKIDITSVSVEDKRSVSRYLHRLFTDDTALSLWWGGLDVRILGRALFETDATTDAIIRWISDDDIDPGEIREWAEFIKADPKSLCAAAIRLSTDKWLRDGHWDAFACFCLIYAYVYRFKLYPEGNPFTSGLSAVQERIVAYDDVLTVLNWVGLSEEPLALTCIGHLLRDVADFDHAEEWYLRAAAASDPPGFPATSGLARTYGLKRNYKNAVDWGNRALENYKVKFIEDARVLAQEVAEWMARLYNVNEVSLDEALAQWETALQHNSREIPFLHVYFDQLEKWEQHTQAISLIQSFADVEWNSPKGVTHSFLVEIVHVHADIHSTVQPLLQRAARATNNIPWLIGLYKAASAAAADLPGPAPDLKANIWEVLCSSLLLDDSQYEDCVLELAEEMLSRATFSAPRGPYSTKSARINSYLCEIYYQRALRAEKDGKDLDPYLSKLKQTACRMETDADIFGEDEDSVKPISRLLVYRFHSPDLLLGTWYRLHGQENEAAPIFWRRISLAIDVLHGNTKTDYDMAYEFLAFALMAAGDIRGCRAALHLIGGPVLEQYLRVWRAETEESGIDKSYKAPRTAQGGCDGPCQRALFIPHGMHVCVDGCLDKGFCSPCLGKLKRRELNYRVCSPDHHWLHITREGLPDLEEGKVRFVADGDESEVVIDREEWFNQLRERWEIGTETDYAIPRVPCTDEYSAAE